MQSRSVRTLQAELHGVLRRQKQRHQDDSFFHNSMSIGQGCLVCAATDNANGNEGQGNWDEETELLTLLGLVEIAGIFRLRRPA